MITGRIHPLVRGAIIAGGAIALTKLLSDSRKNHQQKEQHPEEQRGSKGGSAKIESKNNKK